MRVSVCLKHLHAKGRTDDLFSDPCYQQFGEELNKVLKDWQPSVLPDGECSQTQSENTICSAPNGCYIKLSFNFGQLSARFDLVVKWETTF